MSRRVPLIETRLILGITTLLLGGSMVLIAQEFDRRGLLFTSTKATGLFLLSILAVVLVAGILIATWSPWWRTPKIWFDNGLKALRRLGVFNLVVFLLLVGGYSFLIFSPAGRYLKDFILRLTLFWMVVLAGAVCIKSYAVQMAWGWALVTSWLLAGAGYQIALFIPDISNYPFTLEWSEASRYYYASLFLAKMVYGYDIPPSPLHPTRYLMQSVPFLISGAPIWLHRLWQVFLWLATSLGLAYLLRRRLLKRGAILKEANPGVAFLTPKIHWIGLLFVAWAFLFLFQGPVYYYLLVMPIIVIWGFDSQKFWKSLGIVVFASVWAGISRVNWYPVPGLLAATIYFLEINIPLNEIRRTWRAYGEYLLKPVAWALLGAIVAIGSQAAYLLWSGVEEKAYTSSFTSDLLWYRLFPNPTFPIGILPAVLFVSTPLVLFTWKGLRGINPVRLIGLGVILFALLIGGIVVSAKIGGGSNLHNLDAYLLVLLVIGSYVFFGTVQQEKPAKSMVAGPSLVWMAVLGLVPVLMAINSGGYNQLPDRNTVRKALDEIKELVYTAVQQEGEVLFISERQLLTFGDLTNIPLVDKFEKVYLMEMVMSGNVPYLNSYYDDLKNHRYALIITDPMKDTMKGKRYSFGEENDVWVRRVVRPTMKDYQQKKFYKEFGIEILEPKSEP